MDNSLQLIRTMLNTITALLYLCSWAFGLSQDQIYHSDWQTINIGIPLDAFYHENKIFTLSDIGVFSIINSTSGDLIYRFKHNRQLDDTSRVIQLTDDLAATISTENNSHLILWNISHSTPAIEFQLQSDIPIRDVALNGNQLYTITDESIEVYNILDSPDAVEHTNLQTVKSGRIFSDSNFNETFILFETANGTGSFFASVVDVDNTEYLLDCQASKAQFFNSKTSGFLCGSNSYKITQRSNSENSFLSKDFDFVPSVQHDTSLLVNKCYGLLVKTDVLEVYDITSDQHNPLMLYFNNIPDDCKVKAFEFDENELKVLCVSESEFFQYVNGSLSWRRDQSFINISDAIIVDKVVKPHVSADEFKSSNSNILSYYINKIFRNWVKVKETLQFHQKKGDIFGFQKYLVALSENQRIGVFDMTRNISSSNQLSFLIIPEYHIDKLTIINNVPYAVSNNTLFEIDLPNKALKSSQINANELTSKSSTAYTAKFLTGSNIIQGYKSSNDLWEETWEFRPVEDETIISFSKRTYDNLHVAQNGIILPNRSVLYKYLTPNIGVVSTLQKSQINIRLINLITGQIYARFTKSLQTANFSPHDFKIVFEENFVIFTMFLEAEFNTEVCVIDLFESLTPNLKKSKNLNYFSSFQDTLLPSFASQCFVIPGRQITTLAVSNTKNNISVKEIVFGSQAGQIFSVPRIVLDGRRGGVAGDFNILGNTKITLSSCERSSMSIYSQKDADSIVSKLAYDPIIIPHPIYLISHYRDILVTRPEKTFAFTVPTELESTTYYVSVGGEIFVTILRPSGSFDKLTNSFNTTAVIVTISLLLLGILFVLPKARRAPLLSLWSL